VTGLQARGIAVHFEGLTALEAVDLSLEPGRIVGLIGPNGAGKTTLLNVLSGFQKPAAGTVLLDGEEVTGWAPHKIARRGVARTFQAVRLFAGLSVLENVQIGAAGVGQGLGTAGQHARDVAARLGLGDRLDMRAGSLPYGEERRVGIARALAMRPKYLMLDEPAAGLNDAELHALLDDLKGLPAAFDCGLLVVEHNMRLIMALCDRIQVLDQGRTLAEGSPNTIRHDPEVRRAYLGTAADTAASPGLAQDAAPC